MTDLPGWSCTGVAPIADLSVLESALHAGRVSAAELGYVLQPQIATYEVMLTNPTAPAEEAQYVTAEEAERAGLDFVPTHFGYLMEYAAEA
jgi:hypothetical protein